MSQPKRVEQMTTEEAIRKLFPDRVIEKVKRIVAESDVRTRRSMAKDATRS